MKVTILSRLASACGVLFLLVLLAACGANPITTSVAKIQSDGGTVTLIPFASPTPPLPTPTPTTPSTGATFRNFNGSDFSISVPVSWQTSQKSLSGGANQPKIDEYAFIAADVISGLHIVRHGQQLAPGDNVNTLLDVQLSCSPGDTSIPAKVTFAGVTWSQYELLCLLHNYYYEVRDLSTTTATGGHTEIMYGAYQQVGSGAVFLDFAHASQLYFEPMLQSFKFK